ncbi:alkaline phosphatase PhoX [Rummeliibacillus pycnus]|uniref:alkaline phosphatase PhoX n=1 Tax=Rummeliibacillus pycnus TaxID=101070 RepID=UPI0037C87250
MMNKRFVKKGAAAALALAIAIPAITPTQAAAKEQLKIESVQFNGMKAPSTIDQMVKTYTTASVNVKYNNGKVKTFPLSYKQLFKSEDKVATAKGEKIPAGTPIDVNGNPIKDPSSTNGKYFISDSPDSNSILNPINGKLFMVTHYEYQTVGADGQSTYGLVPASMSLTELDQNKKTGELTPKKVSKIDFSSVNGLWIPCNGSLSPWNTHLGSEEYEPDARTFESDPKSSARTWTESFAKFYFGDAKKANPYFYGYSPEITVNKNGDTSVVKHYSTGRFSHELMKVMPDNKTVFFGDDGGNTGMFMYVADNEKDLSAGTLYAAKFKQTGIENGGSGDLQWINLGHATDKEVKDIIDSGIKFSDIFETSDTPAPGFTAIKTYASKKVEYLKVKPGKEKAAAFLESRRYAAILGATTEFNKMEGVTLNAKDSKVYIAISYQEGSMEKDATGKDPADHIQLPKIKSGVTYQLDLNKGQKDSKGTAINSSYVAASMSGLVVGEDLPAADSYGNTATVDKVANPDNLSYSEAMRTLFIGEDSGMHTNNYVWAYNVDTKKLDRVLSTPAGAESTGLFAADNRNDFAYILSNFQHPGDELDTKSITAVNKDELEKAIDTQIGINKTGGIGYISGLPSLVKMPDFAPPKTPTVKRVTQKTTSITGKTEANATVFIYNGNKLLGKTVANSKGDYKVKIKAQKKGTTLKVVAQDQAGNKSNGTAIKVSK